MKDIQANWVYPAQLTLKLSPGENFFIPNEHLNLPEGCRNRGMWRRRAHQGKTQGRMEK